MSELLSPALVLLVMVAIGIDLLIGDPRAIPHPVVIIGGVIARLEQASNRGAAARRRLAGVALVIVVVGGTLLTVWLLLALAGWLHPWLGWLLHAWLLASCLAIKGLADAARAVAEPLTRADLDAARTALAQIVGRDTEQLDEPDLVRGAVETVAENTVDGVTAPLFFAIIGGAPLAMAYKAVNTLDSMVGYRDARYRDFGWASARVDDIANWVPARLTALCFWLGAHAGAGANGWRLTGVLAATRAEAPRHPSPNAGWPEAMVANLLGVRLGGVNQYRGQRSVRAVMGPGLVPLRAALIEQVIRLMHRAWCVFLTGLLLAAGITMLLRGG